MEFLVGFNKNKQFLKFVIHDVSQETFKRRGGGRWGYYIQSYPRNIKKGIFGEIHLVKKGIRVDTLVHELTHFLSDYLNSRGISLNPYSEERIAMMMDEIIRKFYIKYRKESLYA